MADLTFSQLSDEELMILVSQFLEAQDIHFSAQWKSDLVNRLGALNSSTPQQFIDKVHDDKLSELRRSGIRWLSSRTIGYPAELIEDVVQAAFMKWLQNFDARKSQRSGNPEFNYLTHCLNSARADESKLQNPLIGRDSRVNKDGEEQTQSSHARSRVAFSTLDDINPREHEQYMSKTIREDIGDDRVKIGGRYFSAETAIEIYKFQLLTGRTKPPGQGRSRALPEVEVTYKPIRSRVLDAASPETVNLTNATRFYRPRARNLHTADTRRWMELALREMRKSKEKLGVFLQSKAAWSRTFKADEFARRTPILSAVALNAHGSLVATCYKGQMDEPSQPERAWYKHCEFSLFEEVIQDRNLGSLKGGTLFVTLEPCNKRGFYLDGAEKKPKIPCAVRCVEAGIKAIYVGALDFNKKVYKKGLEILEKGEYSFDLDSMDENPEPLDAYFSKKYKSTTVGRIKTYKIGNRVTVCRFDDDLIEEICEINSFFLHAHQRSAFR